ncbi:MAG: S8 family serine peptidase [Armatimonadota bacterium]
MPVTPPVNINQYQPAALVRWADQHAGPWKVTLPNGRQIQLSAVRNGRPLLLGTDNLNAAKSVGAEPLWPGVSNPDGLDGTGIRMGLFEGTIPLSSHPELAGRCQVYSASYGTHTTHVAGTLISQGLNPAAKGMAPNASISCYSWNNDVSAIVSLPSDIGITNHSYSLRVGWDFNARGDNRWLWAGDPSVSIDEDMDFGRYDSTARDWDQALFTKQNVLACRSAGNDRRQGPSSQPVEHWVWSDSQGQYVLSTDVRQLDGGNLGYGSVHDGGCAKNALTVGSVADITPPVTDQTVLYASSFSSCGPTDDGRIKPEISGNGESLTSTVYDAQMAPTYAASSGTSMASPSVAGGLALIVQRFRQLHPGVVLSAAALKALAIHTAKGGLEGPNYRTGWGILSAQSAVKLLDDESSGQSMLTQTSLTSGQTKQWQLYHPGGSFRTTLCWADPAAPEQTTHNDSSPRLVVDLDLLVTGSDGSIYPWTLTPSQPELKAVKGINDRDNVERVDAVDLPAGYYTVSVSCLKLPQKYSPFAFSLAVSGICLPATRLFLNASPNIYIGDRASVPVSVEVTAPGMHVTRSADMQNTLEITDIPLGSGQLAITAPRFLKRIVGFESTGNDLTINVAMTNGDADSNGSIDLFDFVELDKNFGGTVGDIDGDGRVNLFDYVVLDVGFGAMADQ